MKLFLSLISLYIVGSLLLNAVDNHSLEMCKAQYSEAYCNNKLKD